MNAAVAFFAGGLAFFPGVGLILLGTWGATSGPKWRTRLASLAIMVGAIFVVASSTPIRWFLIVAIVLATAYWMRARRRRTARELFYSQFAVTAVWVFVVAFELPYHAMPRIAFDARPTVWVIGDSITAGLGDDGIETWPRILQRVDGFTITDSSHVGETARSALKRIHDVDVDAELVVVEVGGNDLLGGRSSQQFSRDLNALLDHACGDGRTVVMFELPLPPFYHGYALAQRRAARAHGVRLIPRHVLMSVLASGGATLDSIHLTASGQESLAEAVRKIWDVAG